MRDRERQTETERERQRQRQRQTDREIEEKESSFFSSGLQWLSFTQTHLLIDYLLSKISLSPNSLSEFLEKKKPNPIPGLRRFHAEGKKATQSFALCLSISPCLCYASDPRGRVTREKTNQISNGYESSSNGLKSTNLKTTASPTLLQPRA